ncbi:MULTISPECIES: type II RES/Xre toxin-antitoxin system antitoxin [Cysteiniphilum]|uniref:DUF2384 domain-containing protein n=1 Tax=Cysteiniphilum litorale TaxID=2056700 RepID=A0A8J3E9I8_9GAMM|nr:MULTISPECIES: antitoxin Xre/MbcA/ParS toxin-binding domain-containing protein [Cysteiniphilum]GGG03915.1 hypothetical protein GCM10010995_21720 [Cysteiniphilum litorale]
MQLVDNLLGRANFKNKHIHAESDLYEEINQGIKSAAILRFAKSSGLTEEIVSSLIPINRKTYLRRKEMGMLDAKESDRLILIAKVYAHALEVFGTKEKVNNWLTTKNLALGERTPLELLKNSLGCQIIDNLLYRISYGIYS